MWMPRYAKVMYQGLDGSVVRSTSYYADMISYGHSQESVNKLQPRAPISTRSGCPPISVWHILGDSSVLGLW